MICVRCNFVRIFGSCHRLNLLGALLVSLLSEESLKSSLPSVDELLTNPVFSSVPVSGGEKPTWKIGPRARDVLARCRMAIEGRLKVDQRLVAALRRRGQAQALSEQERKVRRSKQKRVSCPL